MHLSIVGSGHTIVFIHGFCESSKMWTAYQTALEKHYQVICIDLPGHGASTTSGIHDQKTIDSVAEAIHELLQSNGIKSYFVIGHSLGGYIALALAELYPENLTGFGLFQSATLADDNAKKDTREKVIKYIDAHGVVSFTDTFVPSLFAPANKKRLAAEIKALQEEAEKTSPEGVKGFAQAMKNRPDRMYVLSKFERPVFIIASELDPAVSAAHSRQMIAAIKMGGSLLLEDAGHNGFLEEEAQCLIFIQDFLRAYLT